MPMNYYEILEVSVNASKEVIKNAYRALSKKYHPDSYNGNKEYAQNKMKDINAAYETLIDDNKRLLYDYDNGFKINPDEPIEDVNIKKEDYDENNQNINNKISKPKINSKIIIIVGIITVVILFFIAFYVGGIIAGDNNKVDKEDGSTYIEQKEDNIKKKENYNNVNTNNENKVPNIKNEEESINVDEKEEEKNNIIINDNENELINGGS